MIEFRKITEDNFEECVSLRVHERQQSFVATNLISMAQAYLSVSNSYCVPMPFAIYDDDTMVGFIMMSYHARPEQMTEHEAFDEPLYSIWRLMIDHAYQDKGYGKQAVTHAVNLLRELPCGPAEKIVISYEPHNDVARKIYAAAGFVEDGRIIDGETLAVLAL